MNPLFVRLRPAWALLFAVALLAMACPLHAQNTPGTVDSSFNPGAFNSVHAVATQPDGKMLIGGSFTSAGSPARNYLARLNTDGTVDASFAPAVNYIVNSILVQADGKIVIGGGFTVVGGQTHNYIARLNPIDGSVDAGFTVNANNGVYGMAVQSDGKIVVAGQFTTMNFQPHYFIARLNSFDGSPDASFTTLGTNDAVFTTAIQADGKIVIGGAFTSISIGSNGYGRSHLARLTNTGALDPDFINSGADSTIFNAAVQEIGRAHV